MTPWRRARALLAALALIACGGPHAAETTADAQSDPVELALIAPDGERFGLAALRGRPLLLFVFTTYDQASQFALTPLIAFLGTHRDLQTLGIAAQPDPEALLPLYRDALGVPFPLVYEVEPQIVAGKSMLGRIETVPTYVLLDASGRVTARHTGALANHELEVFVASALR